MFETIARLNNMTEDEVIEDIGVPFNLSSTNFMNAYYGYLVKLGNQMQRSDDLLKQHVGESLVEFAIPHIYSPKAIHEHNWLYVMFQYYGEIESGRLKEVARKQGYSEHQLRKAFKALHGVYRQEGHGRQLTTYWRLP